MPEWLYLLLQTGINVAVVVFFTRRSYLSGHPAGLDDALEISRPIEAVMEGGPRRG